MNNNNREDGNKEVMDSDDTAELVTLEPDTALLAGVGESTPDASAARPESQGFSWLKHIESELERLQTRWTQIDAQLGGRDAQIEDLIGQIKARDAAAAAQAQHLEASAEALREAQLRAQGLDNALTAARTEIEQLRQEHEQQRAEHEQLATRFAAVAESSHEKILELERRYAELQGRRRERDDAYRELEEKCADQMKTAELLRVERDDLASILAQTRHERTEHERKAEFAAEQARKAEADVATERARIRALEAALEEQRDAMGRLGKNLSRINVLGTNLQRMERADARTAADKRTEERPSSNVHYLATADASRPRTRMLVSLVDPGGSTYALDKQEIIIGRSRESDIRIEGQFVSRLHARLVIQGGGTVIEDMGSKNGILVNSRPVTRCTLKDGDIVSLSGKLDLRYIELDA
jgi:hypothetical protein